MRIVAVVADWARERCFPKAAWDKLAGLGEFRWVKEFPRNDPAAYAKLVSDAEVLVTGWGSPRTSREVLDACSSLKMIAHSAGSVAGVDIHAWQRGITVTNVMPIMAMGVAEFAVTCILAGLRRFDALVDPKRWDTTPYFSVPKVTFALRNKMVGLVGLGIIGRATLDLLKPFGCKFQVYDPYMPAGEIQKLGALSVDLDTLMKTSDVVSLHAPGTPATKHIINRARLESLKPGAILVNTARGILIDHDALADVAAKGQIGVYLDVTTPEPLPPEHPLRALTNVLISPHVAGPTVEGWPLMGEACVADIERFVKGDKVKYFVTEAQYANQSTS